LVGYKNRRSNCTMISNYNSLSSKCEVHLVIEKDMKSGEQFSRRYGEDYWKGVFPQRWCQSANVKKASLEENMARLESTHTWKSYCVNWMCIREIQKHIRKKQGQRPMLTPILNKPVFNRKEVVDHYCCSPCHIPRSF
jgi:hypothetical protein